MADWQYFTLDVPEDLGADEREQLADLAIEHIFDRTNRGIDKNGTRFPPYSKGYIKSLDFKNAGKSAGKVDLQLSGDMLAAIRLLSHAKGSITIGFDKGTAENAQAEGNILGSYGGAPKASRARDFLGLETAKLRELIDAVKTDKGESDDDG